MTVNAHAPAASAAAETERSVADLPILPPEIIEVIFSFAGVEICAAFRHLPALRKLLSRYARSGKHSLNYQRDMFRTLIDCHWSAGMQALVDANLAVPFRDSGSAEEYIKRGYKVDIKDPKLVQYVMPVAAQYGRLDLVQELDAINPSVLRESSEAWDPLGTAAYWGQGQVFRWIYERHPQAIDWYVVLDLARHGHADLVEELVNNGHAIQPDGNYMDREEWWDKAGEVAATQDARVYRALLHFWPYFSMMAVVARDASSILLETLQWAIRHDNPSPDVAVF
ncbi:hypothetical protein RI367_007275 [Sorochytrium milnesiophthora]